MNTPVTSSHNPTGPQSTNSRSPTTANRWIITTTNGETITGHLPSWAAEDPTEHAVPPNELDTRLADISHSTQFPGLALRAYSPAHPTAHPTPTEIFHSSIDCTPYADRPQSRIPVVNIHIARDLWLTDLGVKELDELVTTLLALSERLDHQVLPALVAARADWNRNRRLSAQPRP